MTKRRPKQQPRSESTGIAADRDVTRFVRDFFRPRVRALSSTSLSALTKASIPTQIKVFNRLGFAANRILGCRFPKTWSEMQRPPANHFLESPSDAIRLAVAKLCVSSSLLKKALFLRLSVEVALFRGDFEQARSLIVEHQAKYGMSLWSMEMEFLRRQFADGFHGNRTALSHFAEQCNSEWVAILADNSSFRIQSNVSTKEFRESCSYLDIRPNNDSIPQYSHDYLCYRFLDELPRRDDALCNVLHFEARHSAIDQFITLLRVLEDRVQRGLPRSEDTALVHLANHLGDSSSALCNLAALTSADYLYPHWSYADDVRKCAEQFLMEKFSNAVDGALKLLTIRPDAFCLYQFAAASAAFIGATQPPQVFPGESIGQVLLNLLFDWYSGLTDRRHSLEILTRLGRALRSTHLGPALASFTCQAGTPPRVLGQVIVPASGSPAEIPQLALAVDDPQLGWRYLRRFTNIHPASTGTALLSEFLAASATKDGQLQCPHISKSSLLLFQGSLYFHRGQFVDATTTLSLYREQNSYANAQYPESLTAEVASLLRIGENEKAATIAAEAFCQNAQHFLPSTLKQFTTLLTSAEYVPQKGNVAWAILAMSAHRTRDVTVSIDKVHDFVGDFLESHGFTRPSELLHNTTGLSRTTTRFLIDCCTPDVLECSIWYSSKEEVYKERLQLCSKLCDFNPDNADELGFEVAYLTRKLAVLDLTSLIERSRIFVDFVAIAERLQESTHETISSLLSIRALLNRDLKRGLRLLGMPSSDGGKIRVISVDQDVKFFESVFLKLRNGFLYSPEHGLDANLSQRVRHGTLAGELRALFDSIHLTTKRDASGNYRENEYWLNQVNVSNQPEAMATSQAFRQFSENLDELIHEVRDEWIQIRSDTKPSGLFCYDFSEEQLTDAVNSLSVLAEHSDVIELVGRMLLRRTEDCLTTVRANFNSSLNARIHCLVNTLLDAVEEIAGQSVGMNAIALRSAVTQCKTEFSRTLEKLANWFHIEDRHEQKSFEFADLLASVVQVLNRIGTHCRLDPRSTILCPKLPGRYFRPFWDMLVILLDNASRHSSLPNTPIILQVTVNSSSAHITCVNPVSSDRDRGQLAQIAADLSILSLVNEHDLNKLRQEGGSGIAKLHKIVRHELGRGDRGYSIQFNVDDECSFEVAIDLGRDFVDANFDN